jgi:hypothetical protein
MSGAVTLSSRVAVLISKLADESFKDPLLGTDMTASIYAVAK